MLLAAGAGRAAPQDLRAGTQHRPMGMRRAGIAFHHVAACMCLVGASFRYMLISRRMRLHTADVLRIPEAE